MAAGVYNIELEQGASWAEVASSAIVAKAGSFVEYQQVA